MNKIAAATFVLLGLASVPAMAATTVQTQGMVSLRTGPDAAYPRVDTLRGGQKVQVHGCLRDWSWCDVSVRGVRGWVLASGLNYQVFGRRISLAAQGPRSGVPVVDFRLARYWDDHYRGKPWYAQKARWAQQRPPAYSHPAPLRPAPAKPQPPQATRPGQGKPSLPGRPPQPHAR